MRARRIALTGPAAAALYQLDGFRDEQWPSLWCAPFGGVTGDRIIRTRYWEQPTLIGDVPVAPLPLVLRHLAAVPQDLQRGDGLAPIDRVELAVEHAVREGIEIHLAGGGNQAGDRLLHAVMSRRPDVPPTGSYAETRAGQLLRSWGLVPWRQVPILVNGRIRYRADFMVPFVWRPRPEIFTPADGALLEVDGREPHEPQFERDHERDATYTELAFHHLAVTPRQVERGPASVWRALAGAFRRAGYTLAVQ